MMSRIFLKIKFFFIVSSLFVGIPVVAWGLNDITGYFQNSARLSYSVMMTILTLLAVLFVPDEGRGSKAGEKLVKRQKIAIILLQFTSIAIVVIAPFFDRHVITVMGNAMVIRHVGLIMTYFLMNLAILQLGRQFSVEVTIQKDHKLITGGIYRVIRYPSYLGIILFMTGISLVFHSWVAVFFSVATLLVLIWRIFDEERMLHQEFQKEWEDYTKKSRRLIPFIF